MQRTPFQTETLLRGCANWVWAEVGAGHREKPYQCALAMALDNVSELCDDPSRARMEAPVAVTFLGNVVGICYADILFDNCVIEVKISDTANHRTAKESHILQTRKYVDLLGASAGFLVVFYLRGVVVHQITK
jgi:GxxExxY protein